jgi:hypothetical protein
VLVKGIEELSLEAHSNPLRDGNVLDDADVRIRKSGSAQRADPWTIAEVEVERAWVLESSLAEQRPLRRIEIVRTLQERVRARLRRNTTHLELRRYVAIARPKEERRTGRDLDQRRQLPSANRPVDNSARIDEALAFSKRKLVQS